MNDFQSIAALTIVFITAAVMIYFRIKKKGNCCGGDCSLSKSSPRSSNKTKFS